MKKYVWLFIAACAVLSGCGGSDTSSTTPSTTGECALTNDAECIGSDLSGQDLSGKGLIGIDFRNANLSNTKFIGAD